MTLATRQTFAAAQSSSMVAFCPYLTRISPRSTLRSRRDVSQPFTYGGGDIFGKSPIHKLLHLAAERQIVRAKDAADLGVPRNYLGRLVQRGLLEKVRRGLYTSSQFSGTEHVSLVEVSYQLPKGIVCLLSALRFHNFTTQSPHEVWIALGQKTWAPKLPSRSIRLVRMSGQTLHFGVEEHRIAGTIIRVFNPAKTAADCFKFRNKIGIEVAIEALKESRTSEVHGAIQRLRSSRLLPGPGLNDKPNISGLEEFLVHGLKYAFPAEHGEVTRGIPTSYAAEPLKSEIAISSDLPPVWPWRDGNTRGVGLGPLYKTVPRAALHDPALYQLLALVDAIRDGRARERSLAERDLVRRLRSVHGQS